MNYKEWRNKRLPETRAGLDAANLCIDIEWVFNSGKADGIQEGLERAAVIAEENTMTHGSIGPLHNMGWDESCGATAKAIRSNSNQQQHDKDQKN